MNGQTDYDEFLRRRGCSLESLGLSELAFTQADVQQAVNLAMVCHLPVLGGDVYFRSGATIEPAYANWHIDRQNGESDAAFIKRSCEETRRYLRALPNPVDKEYLIVIVTA